MGGSAAAAAPKELLPLIIAFLGRHGMDMAAGAVKADAKKCKDALVRACVRLPRARVVRDAAADSAVRRSDAGMPERRRPCLPGGPAAGAGGRPAGHLRRTHGVTAEVRARGARRGARGGRVAAPGLAAAMPQLCAAITTTQPDGAVACPHAQPEAQA
jgi:hypothetical protein